MYKPIFLYGNILHTYTHSVGRELYSNSVTIARLQAEGKANLATLGPSVKTTMLLCVCARENYCTGVCVRA